MVVQIDDRGDLAKLPSISTPSAMLVAFSKFGYGHVSRCLKIARALVRHGVTSVVVSSQREFVDCLDERGIVNVTLPQFGFGGDQPPKDIPRDDLTSPVPGISSLELSSYRAYLLRDVAARLCPDVLVLDSFPFHPNKSWRECGRLIEWNAANRQVPVLAGFRGEMSRTYSRTEESQIVDLVRNCLDKVLVYVDPREANEVSTRYRFLNEISSSLSYVGYVAPQPRRLHSPAHGRTWIGTLGGGIDGDDIARAICGAFASLSLKLPNRKLILVTGQRLPEQSYHTLVRDYGDHPRIKIVRHIDRIADSFPFAELVLSMGGYNTCTELFSLAKRAVVLPRMTSTNREQYWEAKKFQRYGGLDHIVLPGQRSHGEIAASIEQVLRQKGRSRMPVDIQGAENAAREIATRALPK